MTITARIILARDLKVDDYLYGSGSGETYLVKEVTPLSDGRIFIDAGKVKLAPVATAMLTIIVDDGGAKRDAVVLMDRGYHPVDRWRAIADGEVVAVVEHLGEFVDLGLDRDENVKFERQYERIDRAWSSDIIFFPER